MKTDFYACHYATRQIKYQLSKYFQEFFTFAFEKLLLDKVNYMSFD